MSNIRFKKPSPALVIAMIALFIGMSGAAYAGNKIGTNRIKGKAVTTGKLASKAVTTGKLAGQAVRTGKLANSAVSQSKIAPDAVGNFEIAQNAVDSSKIQDGSISRSKLQDEAVGAKQLGSIVTRAAAATIGVGNTGGATATCQDHEKVISGGYNTPTSTTIFWSTQESVRVSAANGWRVQGLNAPGSSAPVSLTVTVYCLVG